MRSTLIEIIAATALWAAVRKGTKVTCQKVKKVGKEIWIKIPSGWICAWTGSKKYVI